MNSLTDSWKMHVSPAVSRSYSLKVDVMVLSVCRVAALMHCKGLGPAQSSLKGEFLLSSSRSPFPPALLPPGFEMHPSMLQGFIITSTMGANSCYFG